MATALELRPVQPPALPGRRPASPFVRLTATVVVVGLLVAVAVGLRLDADRAGQDAVAHAGIADGRIGDARVTAFDTDLPAVSGLDPALRSALQDAADGASEDGLDLLLTSGWRSRSYQADLLHDAVAEYGSRAAASRWVDTPSTSHHVTGDAVDVGPAAAASWLETHGPAWGLCRVYANEPWHFELLTSPGGACPALIADAGQD